MNIKDEILTSVRRNKRCKSRLALELGKSEQTISRWTKKPANIALSAPDITKIISEELNVPVSKLFNKK